VADWRDVARGEGWKVFRKSVRLTLGARQHTVRVRERELELEFAADVPRMADPADLVELLVMNRSAGLAYWHVDNGHAWALSSCPKTATDQVMAAYLRETAALADRLELRLSEIDR
jgi:hypothetical protein